MTDRMTLLGSAATALGAMPFAGAALAQTAGTGDAAPSEAAAEAPVPASSDYGASTASAPIDVHQPNRG
jgi:lactate oxidase